MRFFIHRAAMPILHAVVLPGALLVTGVVGVVTLLAAPVAAAILAAFVVGFAVQTFDDRYPLGNQRRWWWHVGGGREGVALVTAYAWLATALLVAACIAIVMHDNVEALRDTMVRYPLVETMAASVFVLGAAWIELVVIDVLIERRRARRPSDVTSRAVRHCEQARDGARCNHRTTRILLTNGQNMCGCCHRRRWPEDRIARVGWKYC